MSREVGKKGDIDRYSNNKLESMVNLMGVVRLADKLGVTVQGIYCNLKKRGYRTKKIYIIDGSTDNK